jgi:hypothetical protein
MTVLRFADAAEVQFCASEDEALLAVGWAVVERDGVFQDEEDDLFLDGEFIGVTEAIDVAPNFVEVTYAPIPPED